MAPDQWNIAFHREALAISFHVRFLFGGWVYVIQKLQGLAAQQTNQTGGGVIYQTSPLKSSTLPLLPLSPCTIIPLPFAPLLPR